MRGFRVSASLISSVQKFRILPPQPIKKRMKKALSPGDLAIITKSLDGLSVGKIVECIQIDGEHSKHGTIWLVKSARPIKSHFGSEDTVHMPAIWLMRIPNDPLPDEEDVFSLDDELVEH